MQKNGIQEVVECKNGIPFVSIIYHECFMTTFYFFIIPHKLLDEIWFLSYSNGKKNWNLRNKLFHTNLFQKSAIHLQPLAFLSL